MQPADARSPVYQNQKPQPKNILPHANTISCRLSVSRALQIAFPLPQANRYKQSKGSNWRKPWIHRFILNPEGWIWLGQGMTKPQGFFRFTLCVSSSDALLQSHSAAQIRYGPTMLMVFSFKMTQMTLRVTVSKKLETPSLGNLTTEQTNPYANFSAPERMYRRDWQCWSHLFHRNCPYSILHSSIRRDFCWLAAVPEERGGGRRLRRYKPLRDTLARGKPMKIMTHLTPHKTASTQSFPHSVKKHHALASNHVGHARLPPVYVENFMHPKHEVFQHNMLGGSRFPCAPVQSKNCVLANTGLYKEHTENLSLQELIWSSFVPWAPRDLSPPALQCTEALQIQASSEDERKAPFLYCFAAVPWVKPSTEVPSYNWNWEDDGYKTWHTWQNRVD